MGNLLRSNRYHRSRDKRTLLCCGETGAEEQRFAFTKLFQLLSRWSADRHSPDVHCSALRYCHSRRRLGVKQHGREQFAWDSKWISILCRRSVAAALVDCSALSFADLISLFDGSWGHFEAKHCNVSSFFLAYCSAANINRRICYPALVVPICHHRFTGSMRSGVFVFD